MSTQDLTTNYQEIKDEQSIIDSIAHATPPSPSTTRIHKVPEMLIKEKDDYKKYYVPKVVSIGPYHFGDNRLKFVEKLKPVFTKKLLLNNKETITSLYRKLSEPKMVQTLRDFYEESVTTKYRNEVFTMMMLQDCCFILYYIQFIFGEKPEKCPELNSRQIVFVHHDLFLLENQIPFMVVNEAMKLISNEFLTKITTFIDENILAWGKPKRKFLEKINCIGYYNVISERPALELTGDKEPDHLLHLLHRTLTKHEDKVPDNDLPSNYRCTFRNVNELVDVGVHFQPSETMSLAHVKFLEGKWWFTADVELPPITVDDSTKRMLLNLIAYEMCSPDAHTASWVTSYICFLDSLIDHPEDVKALRKAGVLENSLGSDKEVARLFNEIGTDLVPNNMAYQEAKYKIQRHYDSERNSLISELKREYVKSPWAFFALLGALVALFFSAVQTYYTVWSPEGECDELCKLLRTTHHL